MTTGTELHWATLWEALADVVGDAPAGVQGCTRRSWFDLDDRAGRLATLFDGGGIGAGDVVAQYLYNSPEYVESWHAAHKIEATPINVNYRYLAEELAKACDARLLIPHHFDLFAFNSRPAVDVRAVLEASGVNYLMPDVGEAVDLRGCF